MLVAFTGLERSRGIQTRLGQKKRRNQPEKVSVFVLFSALLSLFIYLYII